MSIISINPLMHNFTKLSHASRYLSNKTKGELKLLNILMAEIGKILGENRGKLGKTFEKTGKFGF